MVEIEWVGSGRAAAVGVERALDRLQAGDPLREVVVITPPGATAGTLRRLLPGARGGHGVAGIRFTTVVDLALELAPAEVAERRPITPQLLAAAVRRELSGPACPPELEAVRDHRSTLDALVAAAERLRNVHLSPDAAATIDQLAHGSSTRRAIAQVASRARAALVSAGFRDEPSVVRAAQGALPTIELPPLLVVFTDCYHPGHVGFLEALLARARECGVVAVRPHPDDSVAAEQIARVTAAAAIEVVAAEVTPPAAVVSCPDQDEEVRHAVRGVVGLVTGVGEPSRVAADRIVVLHPPSDGYARRITDELARAGLPWSGPAPGTLAESIAGACTRLLLAALERCDRTNVFRLLDVAPLWPTRKAGRRATTRWRALCRDLKLVTEADWARAPQALAERQAMWRSRRGGGDPTEQDLRAARQLEQLLEIVDDLRRARARLLGAATWADATTVLLGTLARHVGTEDWRAAAWADIPIWQHRAAVQVESRLRALSLLDDAAFPVPYSFADLHQIVTSLLDAPLGRQGDPATGVRVLGLNHGVCLDADVVFVVGLNDGVVPAAPTEDLLVRRSMPAACGRWIEGATWSAERLRRAWVALSNSGVELRASFARSDLRRGGAAYPSAWLPTTEVHLHQSHAAGLDDDRVLTPAERLRRVGPAAAGEVEIVRRRALAVSSRLQPTPTEFDGQLGSHPELDPAARSHAITTFESLATCGTTFLLRQVLGVDDTTDPALITTIEARDKGDLIHEALQRVVEDWLELPEPRPAWLQGDHLDDCLEQAERFVDEYAARLRADNRLGHEMAWSLDRRMLLQAISATLHDEAAAGTSPLAAEHSFGLSGGAPELEVETAHGPLRFRGRIDRIDRTPSGVRVTDFKSTSASSKYGSSADPVDGGKKLQLPLYAEVARRDFAAEGDDIAARYLYLRRSFSEATPLAEGAWEPCVEQLGVIAGRLVEGDLRPGLPHDKWACTSCSPDSLGLDVISMRVKGWTPDPEGPPADDEVGS